MSSTTTETASSLAISNVMKQLQIFGIISAVFGGVILWELVTCFPAEARYIFWPEFKQFLLHRKLPSFPSILWVYPSTFSHCAIVWQCQLTASSMRECLWFLQLDFPCHWYLLMVVIQVWHLISLRYTKHTSFYAVQQYSTEQLSLSYVHLPFETANDQWQSSYGAVMDQNAPFIFFVLSFSICLQVFRPFPQTRLQWKSIFHGWSTSLAAFFSMS